jgi:hypothetical protein
MSRYIYISEEYYESEEVEAYENTKFYLAWQENLYDTFQSRR